MYILGRTLIAMQDHFSSPPSLPGKRNENIDILHLSPLQNWFALHPWSGTILLFVYFWGLAFLFDVLLSLLMRGWHLSLGAKVLIPESFYAVLVILPLTLLGWWSKTGFTRGIHARDLLLYIVPFILLVLPTFALLPGVLTESAPQLTILAACVVVLVGFVEEGFFRGVLLQCALPRGIWPSVILSTFLFSLAHIGNIFSGFSWNYIIAQVLLTIGMGVLLSALRLRSETIWLCILLHAAHDFTGMMQLFINPGQLFAVSLTTALVGGGIYCALLLLTAFILLRPRKVRELRMRYGLAPAPLASSPISSNDVSA